MSQLVIVLQYCSRGTPGGFIWMPLCQHSHVTTGTTYVTSTSCLRESQQPHFCSVTWFYKNLSLHPPLILITTTHKNNYREYWGFFINKSLSFLEPEIPSLLKSTTNAIEVSFKELTGVSKNYAYKIEAQGLDGDKHDGVCSDKNNVCRLEGLEPARCYEIGLRACFSPHANAEVCSSTKGTVTICTLPEGKAVWIWWYYAFCISFLQCVW